MKILDFLPISTKESEEYAFLISSLAELIETSTQLLSIDDQYELSYPSAGSSCDFMKKLFSLSIKSTWPPRSGATTGFSKLIASAIGRPKPSPLVHVTYTSVIL